MQFPLDYFQPTVAAESSSQWLRSQTRVTRLDLQGPRPQPAGKTPPTTCLLLHNVCLSSLALDESFSEMTSTLNGKNKKWCPRVAYDSPVGGAVAVELGQGHLLQLDLQFLVLALQVYDHAVQEVDLDRKSKGKKTTQCI